MRAMQLKINAKPLIDPSLNEPLSVLTSHDLTHLPLSDLLTFHGQAEKPCLYHESSMGRQQSLTGVLPHPCHTPRCLRQGWVANPCFHLSQPLWHCGSGQPLWHVGCHNISILYAVLWQQRQQSLTGVLPHPCNTPRSLRQGWVANPCFHLSQPLWHCGSGQPLWHVGCHNISILYAVLWQQRWSCSFVAWCSWRRMTCEAGSKALLPHRRSRQQRLTVHVLHGALGEE